MNSAHIRRVIAAGMIGNALEWYDFAIYGYFAVQIGRHFFPHDDAVAQLLSAFGIFAIGYLMRPIGGVLVGHIGDRFGRRTALISSVTAMVIPTFLMGLLPGYSSEGWFNSQTKRHEHHSATEGARTAAGGHSTRLPRAAGTLIVMEAR